MALRSRFADYTGMWANHYHIPMHEDHGMMQAVEVVPRRELSAADPCDLVRDAIRRRRRDLPAPPLSLMHTQSLSFVDSSPELGQAFPGFPLEVPKLAE